MTGNATEQRIADLEAELAFQGQHIQSLNDALATQQQDMLELQRKVTLLGEQLLSFRDAAAGITQGDEKPPHY